MTTQEVIDAIFSDPTVKYDLTEFQGLEKTIPEMLNIESRQGTGKQTGKVVYYIKPLCKFHSEKTEFQIYVEGGKSNPEEIVRQLWVWKLINYYGYDPEQIRCEIPVQFGSEVPTKYADIAVYRKTDLETVKILFEVKKPKRKDGIEQLKSYLGAKGNPIGVWSNGADKLILYKPQNKDFDTLSEVPKVKEEANNVLEIKRTLANLRTQFNFKKIVQDLEELVLADSGVDEFNEIFKLIYAKIYDEKVAAEDRRRKQEVEFKKYADPELTYEAINNLYHKACEKWPGVFEEPNIKLRKDHLQICIGPIEGIRLLGSNLRIMDDAFEYLMPTEAKKKKGQFFTPRHVIEMCVRMLNPKDYEYVIDPACGSAGFLLHAMEWAMPAETTDEQELRKSRYAAKYLWGIDFEARAAKTSRALMLIAGDGHTNIFGPDVSSIDPKTWYNTMSGRLLMTELRKTSLLVNPVPETELLIDEDKAWDYFEHMKFDLVLANPPFAGELKDKKMLQHYELAKPALRRAKDKQPKEERDVIFIERIINILRPGGRAAIVLPQGKFNNSSLAFIREFILHKARLLAVVGLHGNTFKPHTGTKTSVLFIQKYTEEEHAEILRIKSEVEDSCPNYEEQILNLINNSSNETDIDESVIPEEILNLLIEEFPGTEEQENTEEVDDSSEESSPVVELTLEEKIEEATDRINDLNHQKLQLSSRLQSLIDEEEALVLTQKTEMELIDADENLDRKGKQEAKKSLKEQHKIAFKSMKDAHKETAKAIKSELKFIDKQLPLAEEALLLLTNKGKLQILLNTPESIEKLRSRFIDAQVAQRLDYPIFMAVSEHGGKNNSGDYEYMKDENGNIVEDMWGNPEIDQDLVNHQVTRDGLIRNAAEYNHTLRDNVSTTSHHNEGVAVAAEEIQLRKGNFIPEENCCIAEAFVKFAVEQGFDFWTED